MRENRFNRNPQVNGNLRGVLSLSCFFFCLHMLPKVSPSFQVHLFIPPRLHDIPVMYFCSLCPLRNDSIVNVELEMELGFASSTGRNHCSESTARLCCVQSPLQSQCCYIFSQQRFAAIFHWLLLSTISCRNIAIIYVLMNSLPFCIGYTWTEATVLYLKT